MKESKNMSTEKKLQALQADYLLDRDPEIFKLIIEEIAPYARSQVLKKTKGKIYLNPDLVNTYAIEATLKFMDQYEKPEFKVATSFGGLLGLKVLEAMHGPKTQRADQVLSLDHHIENGKSCSNTDFGDLPELFNFNYCFRQDGSAITEDPIQYLFNEDKDVIQSVLTAYDDIHSSAPSLHDYFIITFGLNLKFAKKKCFESYKQKYMSAKQQEAFDLALLEIYNRLRDVA